ncbi:uncharacterized protein E0L32_009560 [Thyridium curvatum]|uniref:Reverse transcriptase RNase H-like domain-containing protein n=1 Tax=Thyridium curvatum TaxID=1093900 RepID=A0A507AVN4_9PEZI|nr:uncharacterized protein E0L32_009560 [Thyridium curvatum]TPX08981.1 hypothetical protein E0L32_009560 [Thyridium curvatum]
MYSTPDLREWKGNSNHLRCSRYGIKGLLLGIPWLRRWSPRIDWKTGHLQWEEAREERPRSGLSGSPRLCETVAYAFDKLKELILQEPILKIPDPEKPFEVETDASEFALGGQLGQRDEEGRVHPVAFYLKKLNGPELNDQIHDKELMAIIEAFREWKHYLTGTKHPVKVYTDHKNLTNFTTTKALNKRQT